ncbi:hypothetical protein [Desulforegula conservatrix]|uniref:hypothetical protein n=1 Tax=Desulforegula conservatrix TaxID=153026 RepID=UPI0006887C52|nr:hypothetical protein [Desulforegula conservatrix]
MLKNVNNKKDLQQFLLSILSTSGTLAGLSLALVGIANIKIASTKIESIADDLFLMSSIGFLVVCYLIFFALRHLQSENIEKWTNAIDIVFLLSITCLVVAGFVVVYTVF